jgi:hypothetical protein
MYENYCKTQFFITILLLDINYEILIINIKKYYSLINEKSPNAMKNKFSSPSQINSKFLAG